MSRVIWPVEFPRSGRGVAAACNIPSGGVIISVPGGMVWTSENARRLLEPWLAKHLPRHGPDDGNDESVIALAVLLELGKGKQSRWEPYVASLPPPGTYDLLLSEWTPQQLAWLHDNEAAAAARTRSVALSEDFADLLRALNDASISRNSEEAACSAVATAIACALQLSPMPGATSVVHVPSAESERLYRWARHSVQSRVFLNGFDTDPAFLPPPGAGASPDSLLTLAMVPLGDMFNHCALGGGAGGDDEGDSDGDDGLTGGAARGGVTGPGATVCVDASVPPSELEPVLADAEWHGAGSQKGASAGAVASSRFAARDTPESNPNDQQTNGTPTNGGCYVLRAPHAIRAGQEIAISYGDRCGRDLLENYGFLLPLCDNPSEAVSVELGGLGLLDDRQPGVVTGEEASQAKAARDLDVDERISSLLSSPAPLLDPLPRAVSRAGEGCCVSPGVLAARIRLFAALGGPQSLELTLPAGKFGALRAGTLDTSGCGSSRGGSALPHPIPLAEPDPDTLAILRALVLADADAAALSGAVSPRSGIALPQCAELSAAESTLLRVRPERFSKAISRDNEIAALRLLAWLLQTQTTPGTPSGGREAVAVTSFSTAQSLVESLARALIADGVALALHQQQHSHTAAPGDTATARYGTALQYRLNTCAIVLSHALYVSRMLGVAEGLPTAGSDLAASINSGLVSARRSLDALLLRGDSPVAYGLEVQEPWATLLLDGRKSTETRAYPLPACLLPRPDAGSSAEPVTVALVRSPSGGLAQHGLQAGEIVGVLAFTGCKRYDSEGEWDTDSEAHCVPRGHPVFGWTEDGPERFGWAVDTASVVTLPSPLPLRLSERQRVVRSVFALGLPAV